MGKLLRVSLLTLALSIPTITYAASASKNLVVYKTTNLAPGELVNLRAAPSTTAKSLARLPINTGGIVPTGEEKKVNNTTWVRVYWSGVGGWMSKAYLTADNELTNTKPSTTGSKPSASTKPATNTTVMKCTGTEPFWNLEITDKQLKVKMMDGPRYVVPVSFRQTSANNRTIAVIAGANATNSAQTFLQKTDNCSDGMSDTNYPYSITGVVNGRQVISGCCKVQ